MDDLAHQRRSSDQNQQLNDRLDRLEKQQERFQVTVGALENSVNTVKMEQAHTRELVDARLRMIEKAGELHAAKIDDIRLLITQQGDAAERTPSGRQLLTKITDVEQDLISVHATSGKHDMRLSSHDEWQNQMKGSISTALWLSSGGLAGFVGLLLWLIQMATAK